MARIASPNTGTPNRAGEQRSNADLGAPLPSSTNQSSTHRASTHQALVSPTLETASAPAITPPARSEPGTGQPLPPTYRGKASGEFQRVVTTHVAPDANQLIVEAEGRLAKLPVSDRNRRLLEVAILRRDTALLNGILESLRGSDV